MSVKAWGLITAKPEASRMVNADQGKLKSIGSLEGHTGVSRSPWVTYAVSAFVRANNSELSECRALDLACGSGRHTMLLAEAGFGEVHAVDRTEPDTTQWPDNARFELLDLEAGTWPLGGQQYDCIVVTNYLYRRSFPELLACLKPSRGMLIYETFMLGNEQFGSPRNPDFLLKPGELLTLTSDFQILAFQQGLRRLPSRAMIQGVVALSGDWSEIQSETTLMIEGHQ